MPGGTFTSQNKKQPGVYINVVSKKRLPVSVGDRGVATICEPLSWGPEKTVMEINIGDSYIPFIGYDQTAEQARFLNEIFTGTVHTAPPVKLLLYRPEGTGATAAKLTHGTLTATAQYPGTRGNDIKIAVLNAADEGHFEVQTLVDGSMKDSQTITDVSELTENDWVYFGGTGEPEETAGVSLLGGSNGTISSAAYADYLTAIEPHVFNILIYDGSDSTVQGAVTSFVKRMRDNLGRKCQAVMSGITADTEAVISTQNGYTLKDGTNITTAQATWWVGGAQAGAAYNESLVYAQHPNATDVFPRLTSAETDRALENGQILFFEEFGSVKIMSDINTLVSYSAEKGPDFSLNQIIRTLDAIANDVYKQFSQYYIGRVQNNETGRDSLKVWLVGYLGEFQASGAIQNFDSGDVIVEAGNAVNAVVVDIAVQPVAAVEKIYMTVTLTDE